MQFLYQIHNVGIYIDDQNREWTEKITQNIAVQFDGFEIYKDTKKIEYKLIVRDIVELDNRADAIVVPECSKYYANDDIFWNNELDIAYQINSDNIVMWTSETTWYTPYLLEILFEKQGITFIHGAAVAIDRQQGVLLLAFGGIGKTCFIANAAHKERITILGDDLILVSSDGMLYSYPRPFCLYKYHKSLFPQYFKIHKVKFVEIRKDMYVARTWRKLKQILHIKDNNSYSFVPVSPARLFPREKIQVTAVPINDIYVLRRNQTVTEIKCSPINSVDKITNFAVAVILHEWDKRLKDMLNHHSQDFCDIREFIDKRYCILHKAFSTAQHMACIDIPEKMSAEKVSVALNQTILED